MIDTFSLLVSHGLILFALVRLLARRDLDREVPADEIGAAPRDA